MRMIERPMTPEEKLATFAYGTVVKVMSRGADTHEPGEWLRQTAEEHAEHAAVHGSDAIGSIYWSARASDETTQVRAWVIEDLENSLTRCAMALWLLQQEPVVEAQDEKP